MDGSEFNFTWGLDNLNDMGYVPLYQFMLRSYSRLGLSRQEMLCLIHLASYHYNSPGGQSRPGLTSIAEHMGYNHKERVSELIAVLESKKMLLVERRPGFTSVYNAKPFAQAAYRLWLQEQQAREGITEKRNTPTASVTEKRNPQEQGITPESNRGITEKRNGVLRKNVTEENQTRTRKQEQVIDDLCLETLLDYGVQEPKASELALMFTFEQVQDGIGRVERRGRRVKDKPAYLISVLVQDTPRPSNGHHSERTGKQISEDRSVCPRCWTRPCRCDEMEDEEKELQPAAGREGEENYD